MPSRIGGTLVRLATAVCAFRESKQDAHLLLNDLFIQMISCCPRRPIKARRSIGPAL
jgi:hypothetical protein